MELIDTHAHLYLDEFREDMPEVLQRCAENGVKKILLPNIDCATINNLISLTESHAELFVPMMGLHPCSVKENYKQELAEIEKHLRKSPFKAVGEIGLDYYWDTSFKQEQVDAFKKQIECAKEMHLPIAIHCRESFDDIIEILTSLKEDKLRGVFHCFTGTLEQAHQVIDLGFFLGIGGVVTFKNSGLDKVVKEIDLEYIILETDAPYLAPVPYRGKRNESAYVKLIAEKIAAVKNISLEEVARITSHNAKGLFAL